MNSLIRNFFPYFITISLFCLFSCYPTSMMETAKPVDKKKAQFALGSYGEYISEEESVAINLQGAVRYGISDNADLGFSYSWLMNSELDFKRVLHYNRYNRSYFSSGIVAKTFVDNDEEGRLGVGIPFYYSWNHDNYLVPYIEQQVCYSFLTYTNNYNYFIYSGGFGLRFGEGLVKGCFELSYYAAFAEDYPYSGVRATLGIIFGRYN